MANDRHRSRRSTPPVRARLGLLSLLFGAGMAFSAVARSPGAPAGQVATLADSASASPAVADTSRVDRVVAELNFARTRPAAYADLVEQWVQSYDGKLLRLPGQIPLVTQEGASAAREAVAYLRRARALRPLRLSAGMSRGAMDLVRDQERSGATGHEGSDGSQVWNRVNRYGRWQESVGENIAYGFRDPREVVISLLIDDGVPDRGHRKNLFDPRFRVAGVAFGSHPEYGSMCVITLAAGYTEGH